MNLINFLIKNYRWILPLFIGGVLVPFIIHFLQKKRKTKILIGQKINRSKNITTYQGQKIIIHQRSMNIADVKDIAQSVFESNFPKLKEQAEIEAKKNVKLFIEELNKKISDRLSEEEINKFQDPDIQYALYEAIKSNARKSSEELRKNLSTLMVERVKNDDKDLKRIVYNEAIGTIGKLTTNQLKILTLCFLLRYTKYTGIVNRETFNNYLNTRIKLFLDFKSTNAEFQHLQYTACANISIGSWDLIKILKENYSFLFLNKIEKAKIDEINIEPNVKQQILAFVENEDKYLFRFINREKLEEYLKERNVLEDFRNKIINLYQNCIKPNTEIEKQINEDSDIGKTILTKLKETPLKNMSLTSVGIVIGATYFEQIVGEKIDIDIWIN